MDSHDFFRLGWFLGYLGIMLAIALVALFAALGTWLERPDDETPGETYRRKRALSKFLALGLGPWLALLIFGALFWWFHHFR